MSFERARKNLSLEFSLLSPQSLIKIIPPSDLHQVCFQNKFFLEVYVYQNYVHLNRNGFGKSLFSMTNMTSDTIKALNFLAECTFLNEKLRSVQKERGLKIDIFFFKVDL